METKPIIEMRLALPEESDGDYSTLASWPKDENEIFSLSGFLSLQQYEFTRKKEVLVMDERTKSLEMKELLITTTVKSTDSYPIYVRFSTEHIYEPMALTKRKQLIHVDRLGK